LQGAATQCFLALHPAVSGANGKYFQNCAFSKRSKASRSPKLGRELWDFTEDLLSKIG
jgi:WW domain-containing oxidoreductase